MDPLFTISSNVYIYKREEIINKSYTNVSIYIIKQIFKHFYGYFNLYQRSSFLASSANIYAFVVFYILYVRLKSWTYI